MFTAQQTDRRAILVSARWRVKADMLKVVTNLLPELVRNTRLEEGNLFYQAGTLQEDPCTIMLLECYRDADALTAHRESVHFREIVTGRIVPLLESREVAIAEGLPV